jgi:hypothetical protein
MVDISEVLLDLGLSDSATDEERAIAASSIRRAEAAIKRFLGYDPYQKERTEFYPQQDFSMDNGSFVWEVNDAVAYQRQLSEGATNVLMVQHIPIRSVSALYIDYDGRGGSKVGSFGSDSLKTEGTDFWPNYNMVDDDGNSMCTDGILRSEGLWPTNPGTVKIVYTAGYSSKELHGQCSLVDATQILEAVVDESVRRAKKVFLTKKQTGKGFVAGTVTSESLGDYSYSIDGSSAASNFGGQYDLLGDTIDRLNDFVNLGYKIGG